MTTERRKIRDLLASPAPRGESLAFLTPGVTQGAYPQKKAVLLSEAEESVRRLMALLLGQSTRHRSQLVQFTQAVAQREKSWRELDALGLAQAIGELRADLARGEDSQDLIARAFSLIREAAGRTLGMRHYASQLAGGWVMLQGMVAEMETGAGKTLTATLPACTAALAGIPVHIVTVNDYLVNRDADWMRPLYESLGLTVGKITEEMDAVQRRAAYRCDIVYCTGKQLVFDYLKDRLALGKPPTRLKLQLEQLQGEQSRARSLLLRGLCYAIVDEADSILIDEARTPLIISRERGALDEDLIYYRAVRIAEQLESGRDYLVDPRARSLEILAEGSARIEEIAEELGGFWRGQRRTLELVDQALKALHLYVRDRHYLVRDGKVQIIDEFTGRTMADRSWERGLHQMIEAKEGCEITRAKETLARISYQQFFRRYLRLAGMTGTAREVAGELWSVYSLKTVVIPSDWPVRRVFDSRNIFKTADEKWTCAVERIEQLHRRGRPVLVGTRTVAASEHLSGLLHERNLSHRVLNARQDEFEAEIVKSAGEGGSILVATNMAGRGTDIKLGGGVDVLGGLHVIATEVHEAGRIDRQLFGRCGRQGDPGSYEMILSLEDELVASYCPAVFAPVLRMLKSAENMHVARLGWLVIRSSQKAAEREHARIRRNMLRFDEHRNTLLAFAGSLE